MASKMTLIPYYYSHVTTKSHAMKIGNQKIPYLAMKQALLVQNLEISNINGSQLITSVPFRKIK